MFHEAEDRPGVPRAISDTLKARAVAARVIALAVLVFLLEAPQDGSPPLAEAALTLWSDPCQVAQQASRRGLPKEPPLRCPAPGSAIHDAQFTRPADAAPWPFDVPPAQMPPTAAPIANSPLPSGKAGPIFRGNE
jgi:hypothetical protein